MSKSLLVACLMPILAGAVAFGADGGFSFQDHPGQYLDVLLDGKLVARYLDAHDTSTPERRDETYKPYLQVYDAEGKEPITNGFNPKGPYPHHRGIYIGWRKIGYNGKEFDRWHMRDSNGPIDPKTKKKGATTGEIVHQKFENQKADAESATFTSIAAWNDDEGKPFMMEERTMTFHRAPSPARVIIDFTSKLTPKGDVLLDGDPEHAGVQYRPANDLDPSKTTYTFPAENPAPHKDLDYPWVGETYTMNNGKSYSVVQMSSPQNPKGARWSAYRNYGRFGAFIKHELKSGESLTLKYRFLIADGPMPGGDAIEKSYDQFAGTTTPTPKVTVMAAEGAKPKAAPKTKPATTKTAKPTKTIDGK